MIEIKFSWETKDGRTSFNLKEDCIFCDYKNGKDLGEYHVHLRDPIVDTVEFYVCTRCKKGYSSIENMRKDATCLLRAVLCGREYKPFVPSWKTLRY